MIKKLTIGSRASKLALIQSYWTRDRLLEHYPELIIEIVEIKTQGDKVLDTALSKIGDKGLFTKELEQELLAGNIDLAVHSMKDLPTVLPEGLEIAVTTEREDCRDVICFAPHISSMDQVQILATSSLRRVAQIKNLYPNISCVDMRGNLQTRFNKLDDPNNKIDAMVLAAAGVKRLGLENRISLELNPEQCLPAVGQGALAIEIYSGNDTLRSFLRKALNDKVVELMVQAERSFLRALEGGCQVPIAAYSQVIPNNHLKLTGLVASLDGAVIIKESIQGELSRAEVLGLELAQKLIARGANELLAAVRRVS